jgi:hypothetical protein
MTAVYLLMGVSCSGKSTVGRALAEYLDCPFYDGDDFHPPENVAKMAGGLPLTDENRWPWLEKLVRLIADHMHRGETAVVACSAQDGESHFEEVDEELTLVDFAPPARPMYSSDLMPVSRCGFISAPPGWHGDWHPAPRRQIIFYLSGEIRRRSAVTSCVTSVQGV